MSAEKTDEILKNTAELGRLSYPNLIKILDILLLLSVSKMETDEKKESRIEIPEIGTVIVNKEFDFEFIPCISLKEKIFSMKRDPNNFLLKELLNLLELKNGGLNA